MAKVTKIGIQGRQDYPQWVTKFKVSYSIYGDIYQDQDQVHEGNVDQNTVVVNNLIQPIVARFVRIHAEEWHGHISMRVELYGCYPPPEECTSPLGMENNGIPDSAITASSEWDPNHGATNARLNKASGGGRSGSWSAKVNEQGQYLQIDLGRIATVTKIGIQGRQDYPQWVTKYKVSFSIYGDIYQDQDQVYVGNADQNSVVVNDVTERIVARFVRINVVEWHGHISMRVELYGCYPPPVECSSPLGMEDTKLPDSAITASSEWDSNHGASNARLNKASGGGRSGSWSAKVNDKNQWIQADLGKITKVTEVGIQGRQDYPQWVTKYQVSFSLDGVNFEHRNQVYIGNYDQNTVVMNGIADPFEARFIRLRPLEWHGHISMRFELYGCPPDIVNGGYSEWGDWDQCSVTCGGGSHVRSRACNSPVPQHGGADCASLGPSQETESCNDNACPIDGGLSEYGDWGECSATCGGGSRERVRTCTSPPPQYGGKGCEGALKETSTCNDQECPIDGGFSEYGDWSECSAACGGGSRERERTCTSPPPQYGGKDCQGALKETSACNNQACAVPIDGGYSSWGSWGECSTTCDPGTRKRTRTCTNPPPQNGGQDCSQLGAAYGTKWCNTKNAEKCKEPVDGGYGKWGRWGACNCNVGVRERTRKCTKPSPKNGGEDCSGLGPDSEETSCTKKQLNKCK